VIYFDMFRQLTHYVLLYYYNITI